MSHHAVLHQMLNVSTLVQDEALNPAIPLSNGEINETPRCGDFRRHKAM